MNYKINHFKTLLTLQKSKVSNHQISRVRWREGGEKMENCNWKDEK